MRHLFSNHLKLASVILLSIGVVSAALAYSLRRSHMPVRRPAKGFKVVTKEVIRMNDPKMKAHPKQADYVITERYQKSDGTWKEIKVAYKLDGTVIREHTSFGIPGDGVFQIDSERGELDFISSMPPKEQTSFVTIADGRHHPRFLKHDVVQGYQTYVLHYTVGADGSYEDEYYAPDLDNYPLRSVKVAPYGGSVTEPIEIRQGDPDESNFSSLPDLKVNYDQFQKKIKALDDDGKHEAAQQMRRELGQRLARGSKPQ